MSGFNPRRAYNRRFELAFTRNGTAEAKISVYTFTNGYFVPKINELVDNATGEIRLPDHSHGGSYDAGTSLNDWLHQQKITQDRVTTERNKYEQGSKFHFTRQLVSPDATIIARAKGSSAKIAKYRADFAMCMLVLEKPEWSHDIGSQGASNSITTHDGLGGNPSCQMESLKDGVQGLSIQDSEKNQNTIITRDEGKEDSGLKQDIRLIDMVSTEPAPKFESVTDRYVPLNTIDIRTSGKAGEVVKTYRLPIDLYSELSETVNLLPFETYIYSHFECDIKFVSNANKFQCGKVLCSVKHDAYECEKDYESINANLCRSHVILDLTANNEGNLHIPFRFRRALMRNVTHVKANSSVRHAEAVKVIIQILSPLRTGASGQQSAKITPFIKLTGCTFAGMSYRVPVQMMPICGNTIKGAVKDIENFLKTPALPNTDGPAESSVSSIIPLGYGNFMTGKGPVYTRVARVDPTAMTSYGIVRPFADDPTDLKQVMKIWGWRNTFMWSSSRSPGDLLGFLYIDPSVRQPQSVDVTPTPLEYVSGMYMFWSGTIELRFDFISNAFHTGTVMIAIEFGRNPTDDGKLQQTSSTYTHTFHLGEQKSTKVVVPYIYDTIMRRSSSEPYTDELGEKTESNAMKIKTCALAPVSYTRVSIKVVNALVPPETVSNEIEVMVYMRAGDDFHVHSLKQNTWFPSREIRDAGASNLMNNFPRDYGQIVKRSPRTQMQSDNDDPDPTLNFNTGRNLVRIQTTDVQMNIKDIMRRKVLLMTRRICAVSDGSSFMIPLACPNRNMFSTKDKGWFAPGLLATPTVSISNLFRFWRGSMRYTIVVEKQGSSLPGVVYITHVPRSGCRIVGLQPPPVHGNPIYASGLTTNVLVPAINPVLTVEVPYDTENTWTLMMEDSVNGSYFARDKADTNVGHLAISAGANFLLSVWWEAGDDFLLANFYGIPKCVSHGTCLEFSEEAVDAVRRRREIIYEEDEVTSSGPHVQMQPMDFLPFDISDLRSYVNHITSSVNIGALGAGAVSTLPTFGAFLSSVATHSLARGISNKVQTTLSSVDMEISSMSNKVDPILESVQALLGVVREKLEGTIPSLARVTKVFSDAIVGLVTSLYLRSWVPLSTCLLTLIKDLAVANISLSDFASTIKSLAAYFEDVFSPAPRTQGASTKESALIGILLGFIGTLFRVKLNSSDFSEFQHRLKFAFTEVSGIAYLNQVITFVSRVYDCVVEMISRALGLVDPSVEALQYITKKSEIIDAFVLDAQFVTSDANKHLRGDPSFRTKYFLVTLQAQQLQRALVLAGGNPGFASLAKFVESVLRKSEEHHMDLRTCPVRIVPFTLTLEGASGIGKSFLADDLITKLHDAIGVTPSTSGVSYTRQSGSPYWTNYSDQKFVVLDDYGQRTDSASVIAEVDDLFSLSTDNLFTPPMAHLEDKKMYANPLGLLLLTNNAFANHLTQQNFCKEAYLRRRNIIFRARKKEKYAQVPTTELPVEVLQSFSHLEFIEYVSCVDGQLGFKETVYNYEEFVAYVGSLFKKHYESKTLIQRKKLQDIYSRLRGAKISDINLACPYKVFQQYRVQQELEEGSNWMFKDSLQRMCAEVAEFADDVFRQEDAPTVQMDSLSKWFSKETMVHLMKAVRRDYAKAQAGAAFVYTSIMPQTHDCGVCHEKMTCIYTCKRNSKQMCAACVLRYGRTRFPMCPLCSDEAHMVNMSKPWMYGYAVAIMIRDNLISLVGLITGYHWTAFWAKVIIGIYEMWHELKAMKTIMMKRLSESKEDVSPRQRDVLIEECEEPQAQSETFHDISHQSQTKEASVLDHFEPAINEEYCADHHCVIESVKEPCLHQHLIANMSFAILHNAELELWKILVDGEYIIIKNQACGNSCPLAKEGVQTQLAKQYLEDNYHELRRKIREYYNHRARREVLMEQIPRFVRPEWMEPQVEAPKGDWWKYLYDKWLEYKNVMIGLATGGALLLVVVKVVNYFSKCPFTQDASPNIGRPETIMRPRMRTGVFSTVRKAPLVQSEATLPEETAAKILRNQLIVRIWKDNHPMNMMHLLGVRGHFAVMPKHYMEAFELAERSNLKITVEPHYTLKENGENHLRHEYIFSAKDFQLVEDVDLAVFHLPPSTPMFKDILGLFALEKDISCEIPSEGLVVRPMPESGIKMVYQVELEPPRANVRSITDNGEYIENRYLLPYNFSIPGACGSVVLVKNRQRPIFAIHAAGYPDGLGYGVFVTQETLAQLISTPVVEMEPIRLPEVTEEAGCIVFDEQTHVDYIGALPKEERPHQATKSKILKSCLNGSDPFIPTTEPAILTSTDPRWVHSKSPLYWGAIKHGQQPRDFKQSDVDEVRDVLYDKFFRQMRPLIANPKRLSPVEAVVGLPFNYYDALKLTTSAGYPWTQFGPDKTKLAWVKPILDPQQKMEDCIIDERVLNEIKRKEDLRRRGIQPVTIFVDTLKDERLKPEKCRKAGGTRVFCASPIDYSISTRQNVLHFCAAYMSKRLNIGSAVGINPLGPEWSSLADKLTSISFKNIVGMDYSNFGPRYHAQLSEAAAYIIRKWTVENVEGVDEIEIATLLNECVNSVHTAGGLVYQQFCGSPSGAPITVIINSIVNWLYMGLSWKHLCGPHVTSKGRGFWAEFFNYTALVVYGDDLIMSVHDDYISLFNGITICKYLAQHEIVATDISKGAELVSHTTLLDAQFLKRGFAPHPTFGHLWLAPLTERVIFEIPQWFHRGNDPVQSLHDSARTALMEMHGHGIRKYYDFKDLLNKKFKEKKVKLCLLDSWYTIDQLWFENKLGLEIEKELLPGQSFHFSLD